MHGMQCRRRDCQCRNKMLFEEQAWLEQYYLTIDCGNIHILERWDWAVSIVNGIIFWLFIFRVPGLRYNLWSCSQQTLRSQHQTPIKFRFGWISGPNLYISKVGCCSPCWEGVFWIRVTINQVKPPNENVSWIAITVIQERKSFVNYVALSLLAEHALYQWR